MKLKKKTDADFTDFEGVESSSLRAFLGVTYFKLNMDQLIEDS